MVSQNRPFHRRSYGLTEIKQKNTDVSIVRIPGDFNHIKLGMDIRQGECVFW